MKGLIAAVIAIVIAYVAISALLWILWNFWWLTFSIAKLIATGIVALPIYVIVRKKLLRA
jgi:hypothetical protein